GEALGLGEHLLGAVTHSLVVANGVVGLPAGVVVEEGAVEDPRGHLEGEGSRCAFGVAVRAPELRGDVPGLVDRRTRDPPCVVVAAGSGNTRHVKGAGGARVSVVRA